MADTGYMAAWAVTVLQQKQAGRNTLRAAGSLGWAFPAAFGAKLAVGDKRRVFGLTGDGGIGYHLADFETALRLKIPVTQIVLNNCSLAFEYHVQKYVHEEMCPEASEFIDVPLCGCGARLWRLWRARHFCRSIHSSAAPRRRVGQARDHRRGGEPRDAAAGDAL